MAGRSTDLIKITGGWVGSGFKSYVDLEVDKAINVTKMIVALSDSSSSDEEPSRPKGDRAKPKRDRSVSSYEAPRSSSTSL